MPSKRPSPLAMDEATAGAATPRSKKRSSRSKSRPRARDRRRSPNPNPSSRRDRRRDGGGGHGSAPSRKSDRKPKPRAFPDSATLATAMASAAAAAASSSSGGAGRGAVQKLWSDADEVALLTGAAAFKDRTGMAPRLPDMGDLFDTLRGSISPHLDQAKVYYKLKRLKSKFQHTVPGDTSSAHDRRVRDLCAALWGAELELPVVNHADAEEAEEEDADEVYTGEDGDAAVRLPMLREVLGEHWRLNGRALSGVSLEKGLALLRSEDASLSEAKWRRQLEADMRMQMRRHDLGKEVYGLLIDAVKGLGP